MRHLSLALMLGVAVVVAAGCKAASNHAADGGDTADCGNAVLDPGEVCDDGNTTGGDGCNPECTSDESCGNQHTDGNVGEVCDDGNVLDGDGCSADCLSDETCGNTIVDQATGETCDDGNSVPMDGCSANCQSNESCGNTITDPGEDCDSGNIATASCDPDCTSPSCGDGVRNTPAGEACDDGNTSNNDACVGCQPARCGDGEVLTTGSSPEACDDGNTNNNDGCKNDCTFNTCGDGVVNQGVEPCDDGNATNTDACLIGCVAARCGDSIVWAGNETCDDSNSASGDGCNSTCHWEPRTYVVSDPAVMVNQPNDCDGNGLMDNLYGYDAQVGFSWADATPFTPSSVRVEVNRGIACWWYMTVILGLPPNPDIVLGTTVNGVGTGGFVLNDDPAADPNFGACICLPPERLYTLNLGVGGYAVGGTNTFLFDAPYVTGYPVSFGLSYSEALGGFARVTVFP